MGMFERDISRKMALTLPQLYEAGRLSYDFSNVHLTLRLLAGIVSSLILWFGSRAIWAEGVVTGDGQVQGHWVLGNWVYTYVVLSVTFYIMLELRLWTWVHVAALIISVVLWYAFLGVYSLIHQYPQDNMFGTTLLVPATN